MLSKKTRVIVNSHNEQDIAFNNCDLENNLNVECSPTSKERIQKQSFETEKNAIELVTKIETEWILISSASYTTKDANINKNHKFFKVNYSEELDYSLSSFKATNTVINEIKNQLQQMDNEQLGKTILDDLLTLFKYNENDKEYLEKLTAIKSLMSFNKIQFFQSLRDNIRYKKILGFIYHFGINVEKDYDQALQYYQQSAAHRDGCCNTIFNWKIIQ
ncbi:11054_t:CDS:1 [Ambispora gerdemannii]|uniref:11054_t:CDS:1 n=1 Tax=Ambispora gerdemannii TaxID=144530 RepID=A0A9N9E5C9_9GLOM|nr:11054_t:CDS:1 [Ambispora gerdemannii]